MSVELTLIRKAFEKGTLPGDVADELKQYLNGNGYIKYHELCNEAYALCQEDTLHCRGMLQSRMEYWQTPMEWDKSSDEDHSPENVKRNVDFFCELACHFDLVHNFHTVPETC